MNNCPANKVWVRPNRSGLRRGHCRKKREPEPDPVTVGTISLGNKTYTLFEGGKGGWFFINKQLKRVYVSSLPLHQEFYTRFY